MCTSPTSLAFYSCSRDPQDLHSFPTRRSSDLLPEQCGLTNEFAEARMNELQREAERAAAEIGMGHGEIAGREPRRQRSEEHTSELQSHVNLVCRLLLGKKKSTARQIRVLLTPT